MEQSGGQQLDVLPEQLPRRSCLSLLANRVYESIGNPPGRSSGDSDIHRRAVGI